eukprot:13769820-Ditylum_brightwellii.AAC.1
MDKYELDKLVTRDGYIYIKIQNGMYRLLQAGILANKLLTERLQTYGYALSTYTPGLWRHKRQPISFAFVVHNVGVKYTQKEHGQHLLSTLKDFYDATLDWSVSIYWGINLLQNYNDPWMVDLSMKKYIPKALTKFQHAAPKRKHHSP